jgi:hypothetical protein
MTRNCEPAWLTLRSAAWLRRRAEQALDRIDPARGTSHASSRADAASGLRARPRRLCRRICLGGGRCTARRRGRQRRCGRPQLQRRPARHGAELDRPRLGDRRRQLGLAGDARDLGASARGRFAASRDLHDRWRDLARGRGDAARPAGHAGLPAVHRPHPRGPARSGLERRRDARREDPGRAVSRDERWRAAVRSQPQPGGPRQLRDRVTRLRDLERARSARRSCSPTTSRSAARGCCRPVAN